MKALILFIAFLGFASNVYCQSNLILKDADGDRIGSVIGFSPAVGIDLDMKNWPSSVVNVFTTEGLIMTLDMGTGRLVERSGSGIFYGTPDCSGQAYLIGSGGIPYPPTSTEYDWIYSSGTIFPIKNSNGNLIGRIEWGAEFVSPIPNCAIYNGTFENTCVEVDCDQIAGGVPVTLVDPEDIGLSPDEWGNYRFTPRINAIVEKSSVIYCNSFESCPAN